MWKNRWVGTFEVGLICWLGDNESATWNEAHIVSYLTLNWILFCIADTLEQRCFTRIRPPDNENTEVGVLGSESRSFFWVGRYSGPGGY